MAVKRIVRAAGVLTGLALLATPAIAGPSPQQQIEFGDSFFSPANPPPASVDAGAREVAWMGPGTQLPHNVRQDKRLFSSGAPSEDFHSYQEDIAAGRYHYYCSVHGSRAGGMDGTVRIRPSASAPVDGSILIRWADSDAEAKHRYRVEFRRAGGRRWKVWKKGTGAPGGQFGLNDNPISPSLTREYQIRVRTFVKGNRERRSGWSPRLTFSLEV